MRLAGGPDAVRRGVDLHRARPARTCAGSRSARSTRPAGEPMPVGPGAAVHRGVRRRPVRLPSTRRCSDLGTPPTDAGARAGVGLGVGSTGSLRAHLADRATASGSSSTAPTRCAWRTSPCRVGRRRPGAARRPRHHAGRHQGRRQRRQRGAGHRPQPRTARSPGSPPSGNRRSASPCSGRPRPRSTA